MLDLPRMVVAQPVGQLDLVERILVEPVLVAGVPGAGQLQFVENTEFHGASSGRKHARKFGARNRR